MRCFRRKNSIYENAKKFLFLFFSFLFFSFYLSFLVLFFTISWPAHHQIVCLFYFYLQGYGTVVKDDGSPLNSYQKHLLALARALVREPKILLWEEDVSLMDEASLRMLTFYLDRVSVPLHKGLPRGLCSPGLWGASGTPHWLKMQLNLSYVQGFKSHCDKTDIRI